MGSKFGERRGVNLAAGFAEAQAQAQAAGVRQLARAVEQKLAENITAMLERAPSVRRAGVGAWVEIAGRCQRCQRRQRQRFRRNGGRGRTLATGWGVLRVWQPHLVCGCGGSGRRVSAGWLRPDQRIGEAVTAPLQRWGALRLSLREMQAEPGPRMLSPLALRPLNQRWHPISAAPARTEAAAMPPILPSDAIWATQRVPSRRYRLDSKGRRRACQRRIKRPICSALGVGPASDRSEGLAWRLADSEDEAAWLAFLSELAALGLTRERPGTRHSGWRQWPVRRLAHRALWRG